MVYFIIYEELLTIIIQIEGIINAGPLTYIYSYEDHFLLTQNLLRLMKILTGWFLSKRMR